jgi:glycosyltransferase involved in cell wall biosynthesis
MKEKTVDTRQNKVFAFGKFLLFQVGGAEKSTHKILEKKRKSGARITMIGFSRTKDFGAQQLKTKTPDFQIKPLTHMTLIKRFSYLEYFLNRAKLREFFSELEPDHEMITYGTYAPICALSYRGQVCIYPRCEYDLGIVNNYFFGTRRILKVLYTFIELPFILLFRSDLRRASRLPRVRLVTNSCYMKDRTQTLLGVTKVEVEYPQIEVKELRNALQQIESPPKKGVVFVGDNHLKGLNIVLSIAAKIPEETFYIFCREPLKPSSANVVFEPWKAPYHVYTRAKLVIVPSQWEEAYGRVAREAYLLGIPLLVSERGGLPETVEHNTSHLVSEYKDVETWVYRIKSVLNCL